MSQVIVHIISSLRDGGAQRALAKIIEENPDQEFIVVSLKSGGVYSGSLKVLSNVRMLSFFSLLKAIFIPQFEITSVIVGWMYHGALATFLTRLINPRVKIIVTYRQTIYRWSDFKILTRLVILGCRFFNNITKVKTVYVAESSLLAHKKFGFDATNAIVVRNGFEIPTLSDEAKKCQQNLIRLVSATRFSAQKQIGVMLTAFSKLEQLHPECHLYLFGEGFTAGNHELVKLLKDLKIGNKVRLCGRTSDIGQIYRDKHFYLQTSSMEGLSNSIGEAMSWGVVPVCSDVGENKLMVGDLGYVYHRADHNELTISLERAVGEYKASIADFYERSRSCRDLIRKDFSVLDARKAWREILEIRE